MVRLRLMRSLPNVSGSIARQRWWRAAIGGLEVAFSRMRSDHVMCGRSLAVPPDAAFSFTFH